MDTKKEYIEFCSEHNWIPLFHQPEWWDSVTDHWRVTKLYGHNSKAFLPYAMEKKLGFTISRNPHLIPYSGLLFAERQYSQEQKEELFLLAQNFLSQFALSEYDCNPMFTRSLNLSINKKRTYILRLDHGKELIHTNFKASLKRQLKKAEKHLNVEETTTLDAFYNVYSDSISRQRGTSLIPRETLKKALALCQNKKNGSIYLAKDRDRQVHAAIFNVYDTETSYYLLGGSAGKHLGSGAMGLLLWHCIQIAITKGKTFFDFEGSEVPGVARFFSTFGGDQIEYPILSSKTQPALKAAMVLKKKLGF